MGEGVSVFAHLPRDHRRIHAFRRCTNVGGKEGRKARRKARSRPVMIGEEKRGNGGRERGHGERTNEEKLKERRIKTKGRMSREGKKEGKSMEELTRYERERKNKE